MDFSQFLAGMGGGGGNGGAANKPFIQIKAGQMNSERVGSHLVISNKLRIAADPRKGILSVSRQPDGMIHIQWRDRSTGALGFDRPAFPDDITFKRIKTPDVKDRVYELKYKASGDSPTAQRWFFWMQESKPEEDEENIKKFINSIDNPPMESAAGSGGGIGGGGEEEVMSMLQGMGIGRGGAGGGAGGGATTGSRPARQLVNTQAVEAALAQLGMMPSPLSPPSSAAAPTISSVSQPNFATPSGSSLSSSVPASATAAASGVQAEDEEMDPDLAEALRLSMVDADIAAGPTPPSNGNNPSGTGGTGQGNGQAPISLEAFSRVMNHLRDQGLLPLEQISTPLQSILSSDEIIPLVQADEPLRNSLLRHLPPGQQDAQNLIEILRSPQLQQAMASLTQALDEDRGGGGRGVISSLGLQGSDGDGAMNRGEGPVGALIAALIAEAERRRNERSRSD